MNTMTIVNFMKAGTDFSGLSLLASATITAIRIAKKNPAYVAQDEPEEATYRRFSAKLRDIDNMRMMWNACNPKNIWSYANYCTFTVKMWGIWDKYRRIERGGR